MPCTFCPIPVTLFVTEMGQIVHRFLPHNHYFDRVYTSLPSIIDVCEFPYAMSSSFMNLLSVFRRNEVCGGGYDG